MTALRDGSKKGARLSDLSVFKAADAAGRSHAVQYHSLPSFGWGRLRAEFPGRYEQAVSPAPDPDGWFRPRVVLERTKAGVLVGGGSSPSLVVTRLSDRRSGLVGLWVGNNSGGDFADLLMTSAG